MAGVRATRGVTLASLVAVLGLFAAVGATAKAEPQIKVLRSIKVPCTPETTGERLPLTFTSGGTGATSSLHILCPQQAKRLLYLRYVPGRGFVERTRLSKHRLSANASTRGYEIVHTKEFTHVAWSEMPKNYWDPRRIVLARRRGHGPWRRTVLRVDAGTESIAADGRTVYVAWTPRSTAGIPSVHVTSVSDETRRTLIAPPGPAPCPYIVAETFAPSIAVTEIGPTVAMTDTCKSGGAGTIDVYRITPDGLVALPTPPNPGRSSIHHPLLFQTPLGLYMTYRTPDARGLGGSPGGGAGELYVARFVDGGWTEPELVSPYSTGLDGKLAVTQGRLLTGYSNGHTKTELAERTNSGWQAVGVKRDVTDLVAQGNRLYFGGSGSLIGRARVR